VFHHFTGETMNYYLEGRYSRDTMNLGLPNSPCFFEYSKGLVKPEQAPNYFPESITSIRLEGVPVRHEYDNQNPRVNVSPSAFERSSLGYNLFDSKQAITNQLIHHMSSVGKDRDRAKKDNLYQIESDILKCQNLLLELEGFYMGQNRGVDQRRLSIEQRLFDLYREKRAEEASCWRDQLWLKRDLIVALKEYLDIQRRKNLVNEIMEGDYSTNQNHN
jgi:hypothetical protein